MLSCNDQILEEEKPRDTVPLSPLKCKHENNSHLFVCGVGHLLSEKKSLKFLFLTVHTSYANKNK